MTNAFSIARPYTKAAFAVAKLAGHVPLWSQALQHLAVIAADAQMQLILKRSSVTKAQLSELFIELLHAASGNGVAQSYDQVENFLRLLTEYKRLTILPVIAALFQQYVAEEAGYLPLTISSAYSMNEKQQSHLKKKLAAQLETDVVTEFSVDEQLIGGLSIRSETWVLDNSIVDKLQRLKSALV